MSNSPGLSFPPLLDLRDAGWSETRMATAASVADVNNRAVERAARERLDLTDHVYGFGHFCDSLAASGRNE